MPIAKKPAVKKTKVAAKGLKAPVDAKSSDSVTIVKKNTIKIKSAVKSIKAQISDVPVAVPVVESGAVLVKDEIKNMAPETEAKPTMVAKIVKKIVKTPTGSIPIHKLGEELPISDDAQVNSAFSEKANKVKMMVEKLEQERAAPVETKETSSGVSVGLYKKIAYSFIFLTIILIAVVAYFMLTKVTIVITPSIEKLTDSLTVGVVEKDVSTGKILGLIEQEEVSLEKTYQSSGENIIGSTVKGMVTIINNYDKNQPLVASTRLLSADNKLFRVKNTINVPAGESVEVEVYADEVKPEMAIEPTTFTIPGLWAGLQDKIYGKSSVKFEYTQDLKKNISQNDIDRAIEDMKKSLVDNVAQKYGQNYKGNDKVIYKIDSSPVTTDIDSKVGEEKDSFKVGMKTKVTIIAFSTKDVVSMIQDKIKTVIPANKMLVKLDEANITYNLSDYSLETDTAVIDVSYAGEIIIKDNAEIISPDNIVGLSNQQLDEYLKSFKEIQSYEIIFSPKFVKKVPNLVDRIKIEIKK